MRRMSVLHQNSRFPSTLKISLGLRPREISRVSPNLLGVGDGFPNTALVLVEHEYIALQIYSTYILSKQITKQMEQHMSKHTRCRCFQMSLFWNIVLTGYKKLSLVEGREGGALSRTLIQIFCSSIFLHSRASKRK